MNNTNTDAYKQHLKNMAANTAAKMRAAASQLENLVNETAAEINTAETENKQAHAELTAAQKSGDYLKIAKAKARVAETEERYRKATTRLPEEAAGKVKAIRREVEEAIASSRLADPESVDLATMELLKSGVMTAADLQNLAEKAIAAGNHTMARLIAAEADRQYNAAKDPATKAASLGVFNSIQEAGTDQKLQAVDIVGDIIRRGCRTPTMFGAAQELTEKALTILRE